MARKILQSITYDSLESLADAAYKHSATDSGAFVYSGRSWVSSWCGTASPASARKLAVEGWHGPEVEALSIVDSAIEAVEAEHEMDGFTHYHDVSGCEVDVARYLSGEPECMIEYEPIPTPRVGRVITLCASVSMSASVSKETIKQRGFGVSALAFALTRLGFAVELWADWTSGSARGGDVGQMRVLVKGLNDELDYAKILFAYAHPAMLRGLVHAAAHDFNAETRRTIGIGSFYGYPSSPEQDLPEGTIYLPEIKSSFDVPTAPELLTRYLKELGIIHTEEG